MDINLTNVWIQAYDDMKDDLDLNPDMVLIEEDLAVVPVLNKLKFYSLVTDNSMSRLNRSSPGIMAKSRPKPDFRFKLTMVSRLEVLMRS